MGSVRVFRLVALAAVVSLIYADGANVFAAEEPVEQARAAIIAYQANLSSFAKFKCRFTYSKASAASYEAALERKYEGVRSCEFQWVVDGDRQKFQTLSKIENKPPKDSKSAREYSVDFIPIADLMKGAERCNFYAPWEKATLKDGRNEPITDLPTPLSMIGWKPHGLTARFDTAQKENGVLSSHGIKVIDGNSMIHAHFDLPWGGRETFLLDPKRGYLPTRINQIFVASKNGRRYPEIRTVLLDAQTVQKSSWFPMHGVTITPVTAQPPRVDIDDIRVTELIVDNVTKEDLEIELPTGTTIFWEVPEQREPLCLRLRQNEKVTPDDIPRIKEMMRKKPTQPRMDTAIHDYRKPSYTKWWLLGSGLTLFGFGAFFVFRRYRIRAS